MKLLSENQIYDISMSRGQAVCPISFAKGMEEAQKLLLESASENFNQWIYKYPDKCDLRDFEKPNHNYFVAEEAWQAAKLSDAKEVERLQKENEELKNKLDNKRIYIKQLKGLLEILKGVQNE